MNLLLVINSINIVRGLQYSQVSASSTMANSAPITMGWSSMHLELKLLTLFAKNTVIFEKQRLMSSDPLNLMKF